MSRVGEARIISTEQITPGEVREERDSWAECEEQGRGRAGPFLHPGLVPWLEGMVSDSKSLDH